MQHSLRAEWHQFRADPPGERFHNHYERAQQASKAKRLVQLVLGVVLIAAGVVMCFIPGPGVLVMVFGLALFSSQSRSVARALDRFELAVRRLGQRLKRRWNHGT